MKKSTKLVLTAVLIFIITLGVYNAALKAEYLKGTYKDPFQNFTDQNFNDFNTVVVNAGSVINVKIEKGDYQVRVHQDATEFIKIKQEGSCLIVDVIFPEKSQRVWASNHVVIACPELQSLRTNTAYTINGKMVTDKEANRQAVMLEGFAQDKLEIKMDNASHVVLAHNNIKFLDAVAGMSSGSNSKLNLTETNQLQAAKLDIRNKSQLILDNLVIHNLSYTFSDSASLDIKKSALQLLKNR